MSSINQNFSFMFSLICIAFALPFITAAPVETRDDPFDTFIEFLLKNHCSMPKEVELPFLDTNLTPFSYLSTPLEECKSLEALKENNEAFLLCKEVFDVLQSITCNEYDSPLPKINSHLSVNVCKDFAAIQNILPEQDEYLSRRLSDNVICKVLCSEKYELLCKTLLWSYDTQSKIKNALDTKVNEVGKDMSSIAPDKGILSTVQAKTSVKNPEDINKMLDKKIIPDSGDTKSSLNGSTMDHLESVSKNPLLDQNAVNKSNSSISNNKDGKFIKSNNASQEAKSSTPSIQPDSQKVSQKNVQIEDIQTAKQNPSPPDENIDHNENIIEQPKNIKIEKPLIDVNPDTNAITSENKNNQNKESNSLPGKENNEDNTNSNINIKSDEKPESSIIPPTDVYNDLNNSDFQDQENETKGKEKETDLNKKVENPKESSVSDVVPSETDSKLLESTVLPIIPDKNEDLEQHQDVKDPDQYNDSENEGDYAKQEYDSGFSPSLKKDSDVKNSEEDVSNQLSSSSNIQRSPENFPGHGPDGNRSYLPVPEDSHFFFYFLSIVLILMAGYLIFHNKQKIIALIVEGRHERRRRSHGAGYKKLETK